jgi:hypothetical protein
MSKCMEGKGYIMYFSLFHSVLFHAFMYRFLVYFILISYSEYT